MNKSAAQTEQAAINAERSALYAREAAGQSVSEAEWLALGDRQHAVDQVLMPTNAQGYYI